MQASDDPPDSASAVIVRRIALSGLLLVLLAACSASSRRQALAPGAQFRDCRDCPKLVVIPPGSVIQGAVGGEAGRDEGAPHLVTIGYRLAVGRTEVTTGEFRAFVSATGYRAGDHCNIWDGHSAASTPGKNWRDPGYGRPPTDAEPAACISWNDAQAYVGWLARETGKPYRLLSESEWEYAARAGHVGRFAWGDDPNDACRTANVADLSSQRLEPPFVPRPGPTAHCSDGYPAIAPAGALRPNDFGLYDMTGNLWEWVQDCYVMPYPENTPSDGRPWLGPEGCDRRVSKGGSWGTSIERQRPTFRGRDAPTLVSQLFGFRVARELD